MSTKKTKVSEICVRYSLVVTVLFLTVCSEQWLLARIPNVSYNIMSKQNKRAEWNAGPKLFYSILNTTRSTLMPYVTSSHGLATFCNN